MRHDQRHHPFRLQVEQREHDAHHDVADEAAEALVEVVGPAQDRRAQDDQRHGQPADLLEPGDQVADDQHFLQHGVLDRGEDQDRDRPPVRVQPARHDLCTQAELQGRVHQKQSGDPDAGRQAGPPADVEARPPVVDAEVAPGPDAVAAQQVPDEQHRDQVEGDVQQLVGQVQVGPGRRRRVQGRRLTRQRLAGGEFGGQ